MTQLDGETALQMHLLKGPSKAIVCLRGHLTTETVGTLTDLSTKLEAPRLVELDLSELSDIDEDGVRALQGLERRLAVRGHLLLVSHARPPVRLRLNKGGLRCQLAPSFPLRRVTCVIPIGGFGSTQAG